jgi:putative cell wall-binding protein
VKKSATLRRAGLAGVATTVALGTCFGTAGTASAANGFAFDRIAGADRYATSAATAAAFGSATTVIVASGEAGHYPDALTASYLAGLKDAPVLLTRNGVVPDSVMDQIEASGAKNAYIVGGADVVSETVRAQLVKAGLVVTRLSGADRYATASKVIDEGDKAPSDTALLATGQNFPDALGGGPVAYAKGMPLAITRPDAIPDEVISSLVKAGVSKVVVLGGTDVVSDAVVSKLADAGITLVKRIGGADRAETSALLAEQEVTPADKGGLGLGFTTAKISVASGADLGDGADALGAAPLSGKNLTPLLIARTATIPGDAVLKYLGDHAATLTDGTIFGGTDAITPAAETQMVEATGSGQVVNTTTQETFSTVQAAIDDADTKDGNTLEVTGTVPGFAVTKAVTIKGMPGAKVTGAIRITGVDGVEVSGFAITAGLVNGAGTVGFYLDNAEGAKIHDNVVSGTSRTGVGVLNATGGDDEKASIEDNTFTNLATGVYNNPTATYVIDGNSFTNDTAGVGGESPATVTDNHFLNNDEGIGLGAEGYTVTGNDFANSKDDHVGDYTDKKYDLTAMIAANSFDESVAVFTATTPGALPSQWIADLS